jgi:hypothetical protein
MATGGEVLTMLCPEKEWVVYGNDFDSIQWIKGEPISKAEFDAGFNKVDAWKAQELTKLESKKSALLTKLGISADEVALLLG